MLCGNISSVKIKYSESEFVTLLMNMGFITPFKSEQCDCATAT